MRSIFHQAPKRVRISFTAVLGYLKSRLFTQALGISQLLNIFTIDQTFFEYAQDNFTRQSKKVQYFPDPVDKPKITDRYQAKKYLDIPRNSITLLVYGAIDIRKDIGGALTWIYRNQLTGKRMNLLIAGKQSEAVKSLIASSPIAKNLQESRSLFIIDRYVNAEEEGLIFSAADLVWLSYLNFNQMSGVMVKAGSFDLPMILPRHGVMGWYKDRLALSEHFEDFSIPRLRYDLHVNPFDCHTWENSMRIIKDSISGN